MHCFEILFTLFLVTQSTFGTAYRPGKPFSPRKYANVNQVTRRDCVPAAPNVSASAVGYPQDPFSAVVIDTFEIIADACRQNNQTDPTTCSDEIAKFIQQSGASTCNLYSNLYNACKSSSNSSLTECSDSLLGYQECSNYTLQAYAYCGCYYSLPTELSSCANEQLQNQTAGNVAVPMSSANSILTTRLVPEPITPIGPAVPPSQTPVLISSQPALETNSTSWITIVSTMYLPIQTPITRSSGSNAQDPNTADPPPIPIPIDGTRTIITTLSILEPASPTPLSKTLNIFPPPPPTPTLSTKTLTLTLLSTITKSHGNPPTAPSIYLSTYTSTILTTLSYTPTPSPSPSPSTTITYKIPRSSNLETPTTLFTTISITQTETIYTNLINEPIATEGVHTIVSSSTASAVKVAVKASGVVTGGGGAGAGNITAPLVGSGSGGGSAGGWCWKAPSCPMRARARRQKRSRVLMMEA